MEIKYPPFEFWQHFKSTKGAMSCAEAIFMYNACLQVPDEGVWVEMGTHKGKSALISLMAWVGREQKKFFLLEPEFTNIDWLSETVNSIDDFKDDFNSKTICAYTPEYSTDFLTKFDNYSYIMWDTGSHGRELVEPEKELLRGRVIKGGIVVMHDINSQFTACTEAYNELIASGEYEPILFDWNEIFDYVKQHDLENGNDSWHQYPELPHPPNFIGALRRK
jgi:hypothetical protein